MFIYIGLCLIQQPNIFRNFNFNIFNAFYSIGFDLVILLGILKILIVLFHYYLYLILVKGVKCRPFSSVCEKNEYFVLITFSDSLFDINH